MNIEFKVNIGENRKSLRLRWTYQKKRYCLGLNLKVSATNYFKAQQIALQIEADMEQGKFDRTLSKYRPQKENFPVEYLTCTKSFDLWLQYKADFLDKKTLVWYGHIQSNLLEYFGNCHISINRQEANSFVWWLRDKKLHSETVRRRIESLQACWGWLIENNYASENPWTGLSKLIKVPSQVPPKPFSLEEVQKIIKGFESHQNYSQLTPFVKFLFGTGCRTGEAIGLCWEDVNVDCSKCLIASQLTEGRRKGTKTGKIRTLYLSLSLQQMLREVRSPNASGLIFLWNGKPINLHNFRQRCWIQILGAANVNYRKPYNTRHTFISHALDQGMTPTAIAEMTGHSVEVLYQHYAGSIKGAARLPEIF